MIRTSRWRWATAMVAVGTLPHRADTPRPVAKASAECAVQGAYASLAVPRGAIAVTTLGDMIHEIEDVYVPTTVAAGNYTVTVTRKGQDFYKVDAANVYVRTLYCYEYAYSESAVLNYDGFGGGRLIFIGP